MNTLELNWEIKEIINRFMNNVYGKKPNLNNSNIKHDGKEGHWLEKQMGIVANSNNAPDIFGYEMKNDTTSKTTFGDWSADYYIYKDKNFNLSRDDFLIIFGKPNTSKNNRYSWSGCPIPNIQHRSQYNGSSFIIDEDDNISILYSYKNDPRTNKNIIVPEHLRLGTITLTKWYRNSLEQKLLRKFGDKGWFKCYKNAQGVYSKISFGNPIIFQDWLRLLKEGIIFFDSGMYQGNPRNYSQWRAYNTYWDKLVIYSYPQD